MGVFMPLKREQKLGLVGLVVIGLLFVVPTFQNCAKTNYAQTTKPSTTNPIATGIITRTVDIDTTQNQKLADLKVLFVIDDSYTMKQSQQLLSYAIDSLLSPLQGRNTSFKVVTTSGVPSNEIDYNISTTYKNELGQIISAAQASAAGTYLIEKNITNATNRRGGIFQFYRESSQAQIDLVKNQIKNAITEAGTNGSDSEEGFCAINRQLFDETASRFFNPGDKAAIILISDEDDSSVFTKCTQRYTQKYSSQGLVYYNYNQMRTQLTLEYQTVQDGIAKWLPAQWGVTLPGLENISIGSNCSSAHITDSLQKIAELVYQVRNVTACKYQAQPSAYLGSDLGDNELSNSRNLCLQAFTLNNLNFNDFYHYLNASKMSAQVSSCAKTSSTTNTISEPYNITSVIQADSAALSTQNLSQSIINRSNELFGSNGYMVASIIHRPGEACQLVSGQAYGTKYINLKNAMGNNGKVESICASSYNTVLDQTSQFIVNEAQRTYVVEPLAANEYILEVSIVRSSIKTKLVRNTDYEVVGSTITLTGYQIQPGDALEVGIGY